MTKLRAVLTAILFIACCVALLGAHNLADVLLRAYSESHIESFGPRIPAFSIEIASYMRNSALLCFGTLGFSLGMATLAWFRSATFEARLGWISILSSINYHVAFFLVGAITIGFFVLPKLANGA